MKIFWAIIVVLAVAAGVLLARGGDDGGPSRGMPELETLTDAPNTDASKGAPTADPSSDAQVHPPTAPDEEDEPVSAAAERLPAGAPEEALASAPAPAPEGDASADMADTADAAEDGREEGFAADPPPPGAPGHDAEAAERARVVAEQAEAAREAEAAAAPAGPSIRINDTWTAPGDGTEANPYQVPWAVLSSAGREYNPREGKTELPAWAAQLDGKHVRLTGFLLFPIVATDADELLVMYNQWDGCCIGIPPTPYDSVEVKLTEPASKDAWRFNYGSVTGVLRVDPYVAGKWLVSLYVLEGAELEATGL